MKHEVYTRGRPQGEAQKNQDRKFPQLPNTSKSNVPQSGEYREIAPGARAVVCAKSPDGYTGYPYIDVVLSNIAPFYRNRIIRIFAIDDEKAQLVTIRSKRRRKAEIPRSYFAEKGLDLDTGDSRIVRRELSDDLVQDLYDFQAGQGQFKKTKGDITP